jgi:hypothetical protein
MLSRSYPSDTTHSDLALVSAAVRDCGLETQPESTWADLITARKPMWTKETVERIVSLVPYRLRRLADQVSSNPRVCKDRTKTVRDLSPAGQKRRIIRKGEFGGTHV